MSIHYTKLYQSKGNWIIFLIIISISITIGINVNEFLKDYFVKKHIKIKNNSKDFIHKLDRIDILLKEAMIAKRTFFFTKEEKNKQFFSIAYNKIINNLNELNELLINSGEQKNIILFNQYIEEILAESSKHINISQINDIEELSIDDFLMSEEAKIQRIKKEIKKIKEKQEENIRQETKQLDEENYFAQLLRILIFIINIIFYFIFIKYIKKQYIERMCIFQNLKKYGSKYIFNNGSNSENYKENEIEHIFNNIKQAIKYTKEISRKNYTYQWENIDSNNVELNKENLAGELFKMRALLLNNSKLEEKRKIEDKKRNWTTQGIAKFGDILRQNFENIELLGVEVITNLVHYLNANQGGLFIYNNDNEEDVYLELVAAYAFDRRKFLNKKIYIGEGLVGTCALEMKTIVIKKIPADYMEITSGLGGANPSSLLIVPLKLENQIFGIIEIASFEKFKPEEIDFVEKLSENIASTFSSVKINQQTARLLDLSKQQAEAKAAQEEEMRQNMEELQATQEEASMKEAEKTGQLNAIEQTNILFELSLKGYILKANSLFFKLFGYREYNVINKHHKILLKENQKENIKYLQFWSDLKNGKMQSGEDLYIGKNNKEVYLKRTYMPILDNEGNVIKILMIGLDITENKKQSMILEQKSREMDEKQIELKLLNEKLSNNQGILKKAVENSKKIEKEIKEKNKILLTKEEELTKNYEELKIKEQKIKIAYRKAESNEKILKKALITSSKKDKESREKIKKAKEIEKLSLIYLKEIKDLKALIKEQEEIIKNKKV